MQRVSHTLASISKSIASHLKLLVISLCLALMRPQMDTVPSIGLPCYRMGIDEPAGPVNKFSWIWIILRLQYTVAHNSRQAMKANSILQLRCSI